MKQLLIVLLIICGIFSYAQTLAPDKKTDFIFPGHSWEYLQDPSINGWNNDEFAISPKNTGVYKGAFTE
jgi:hypothetical protein